MKRIIAAILTVLVPAALPLHAKFTQAAGNNGECPDEQFLCEEDTYKWCCDNNPE